MPVDALRLLLFSVLIYASQTVCAVLLLLWLLKSHLQVGGPPFTCLHKQHTHTCMLYSMDVALVTLQVVCDHGGTVVKTARLLLMADGAQDEDE